jgi:hypothetical protein
VQADVDGEIPIRATLPKNRHGANGVQVDMRFNGGFMAFREGDGAGLLAAPSARNGARK